MAFITNSTSSVLKDLIQKSLQIQSGHPAHYRLTTHRENLDGNPMVRRWTSGKRDTSQKNKSILVVGGTGTGKTTLINTMVNYILGVKFEDHVWFEITEEEEKSYETQTTDVTVYEVFVQEGPFSLTIIDTPGYGDTRGIEKDQLIAENLLQSFRSENGVHEMNAVGLVLKASQSRLSDREHYIFDAILYLFGKDIAENILLLITHSNGRVPRSVLSAITEAKIPCAKNGNGRPVHFLFDNCQSQPFDDDEEYESSKPEWDIGVKSMEKLMVSLDKMTLRSLKMTEGVLKERKQLEKFGHMDVWRGLNLKLEEAKSRFVDEAYQCIMTLENIALKTKTQSTLQHLDFLIEKMKETGNTERVHKLEAIKKGFEDENNRATGYFRASQKVMGKFLLGNK